MYASELRRTKLVIKERFLGGSAQEVQLHNSNRALLSENTISSNVRRGQSERVRYAIAGKRFGKSARRELHDQVLASV